jgi:hypothetical protein
MGAGVVNPDLKLRKRRFGSMAKPVLGNSVVLSNDVVRRRIAARGFAEAFAALSGGEESPTLAIPDSASPSLGE